MNSFNPEELQRMILDKFDATFAHENIFERRRKKILKAFSGVELLIPWYLIPFRKIVTSIALYAFEKGMEENNKNDTVTVKRPTEYKSNE